MEKSVLGSRLGSVPFPQRKGMSQTLPRLNHLTGFKEFVYQKCIRGSMRQVLVPFICKGIKNYDTFLYLWCQILGPHLSLSSELNIVC